MRNVSWTAAVCLALVLATAPARAQGLSNLGSGLHAATFGGSAAQTVINTPIDTSLTIAPVQTPSATSYLPSFFRNLVFPSATPMIGSSPLPAPASFPTYPNFQSTTFTPANNTPSRYVPFFRSMN